MFKIEQFPLSNQFHTLSADSTIEELSSYLQKNQDVFVAFGSEAFDHLPLTLTRAAAQP